MVDAWYWARLAGAIIEICVGIIVFASAPRRPTNQFLGLLLVLLGIGPLGVMHWLRAVLQGTPWQDAAHASIFAALGAMPFLYVMFAAHAVQSPKTAWLRTPKARLIAYALAATSMVLNAATFDAEATPIINALMIVAAASIAFTLSLLQYQRSHGAPRNRAREYLVAFAIRDAIYILLSVLVIISQFSTFSRLWFDVPVMLFLVSDALIVHGLLRGQMLALDHKVLRAGAGAIAALILVVAFVVVTELIEGVVASRDDRFGLAAAVALALAFGPVQRASQRQLRTLFPEAKPLRDMDLRERELAYQEILELALADGVVDDHERHMLAKSATRLGLSNHAIEAIELRLLSRKRQGSGMAV